ncbi:MAG TPA: efflux RND transporter periplasmic adaptor subunit [Nevskiaceae bacterium]|nr:efflux RND transporter periplasmic adaptor subunit [Nevskiaceae bacterium]
MNRKTVVTTLACAIVAALLFMLWRSGSHKAAPDYVTVKADRGRIAARVTATGTLSALVTVQVGSQVSGRIADIEVDYNSTVKKGQLLARIDPQLFEAALQQAQANLKAAQGNLVKARVQAKDAHRQADRSDELYAQKLIAQSDRDTARANADAADAAIVAADGEVAQAQASADQASVNLAYTKILSPTDGVVISRAVDVGQTVAAALQAPTLFVIAQDLSQMQVDTSVAESDIGKLTEGMPVMFTVDAYPNERFRGSVRQIRNAPTTVQNVVTYDAVIAVANPDLKLKPGMTANATFTYADKSDVLRVPNAALRFKPAADQVPGPKADAPREHGQRGGGDRSQRTLWVLRGGQAQPVTVQTGISDGSLTEIADGDLHEGDDLITDIKGGTASKPASAPGPRMF